MKAICLPRRNRSSFWAFSVLRTKRVELVRQVHTLFVRSVQQVVVFELQVREEVEGVRQEVREVKGERYREFHPSLILSPQGRQQKSESWNRPNRQC